MRRALGLALVAAVAAAGITGGCLSRRRSQGGSADASAPSASPATSAPRGEEPALAIATIDLATFAPLLDDPRLEAAKAASEAGRLGDAARAIAAARAPLAPGDPDASRFDFASARLRARASDDAGALVAYDAVVGPLAPYARLAAAQMLVRAGRLDEGALRAEDVPPGLPISSTASLLVGEALAAKGDAAGAAAILRPYLAASRHPARWVEVALRLADVLLAPPVDAARADEARVLARRVLVEAPGSTGAARARELERRAIEASPPERRGAALGAIDPKDVAGLAAALSRDELLARALSLADAGKDDDAARALEALAQAAPAGGADDIGCRSALALAQLRAKRRERALAPAAFGVAIDHCAAQPDRLVEALFGGGKASAQASRCGEAMQRFAEVERTNAGHRLADDARVREADCALELGDEARFTDLLLRIADDYPSGDLTPEGLHKLASRRMLRGDFRGALVPLERAVKLPGREKPAYLAGRARYFRARSLAAIGEADAARADWISVVETAPLSYYALLAHARLAEIDAGLARETLEKALSREPSGTLDVQDSPLLHGAAFERAGELLRQGAFDEAHAELREAGLLADDVPEGVLWALAAALARAGAFELSHGLPRSRLGGWVEHYPAGRWRSAWEIAFPRPRRALVEREAARAGIPASLAYAIMREESAFDEAAASGAHAYGLMQLIVPTARALAKKSGLGVAVDERSLTRPEVNVPLGCRFLADLEARFPKLPWLAIPAYNAGPGAVDRWLAGRGTESFDLFVESIPYEETRKYTRRVIASYAAYALLYEPAALEGALHLPATAEAR